MKVYKVLPDTDFSLMYPEDDVYNSDEWEFKAEPLLGKLPNVFNAYFSKKGDKPLPDIAYIGMSTFAFRKEIATELVDILEEAGEMLPFYVDEELWYCLNVTVQSNALGEENSKYKINNGIIKMHLTEYVFIESKLPSSSLFKIPDDNFTHIFCADRRDNDEHVLNNFFCAVSANEYTGLRFEEVFDSTIN
ncbi:hypothetical protein [Endozoicomonas arenosclerae]|uniref:hypothetical protein n=1 Tax=Endozoicomonas arenosclerae TaxID=1633495 RepID=UPI0007819EB9|nr:hypothetical protein [Endozoicomonas arenosclerae]